MVVDGGWWCVVVCVVVCMMVVAAAAAAAAAVVAAVVLAVVVVVLVVVVVVVVVVCMVATVGDGVVVGSAALPLSTGPFSWLAHHQLRFGEARWRHHLLDRRGRRQRGAQRNLWRQRPGAG